MVSAARASGMGDGDATQGDPDIYSEAGSDPGVSVDQPAVAAVAQPDVAVLRHRSHPKILGIITNLMICVCPHMIEWVQNDFPPADVINVVNATNIEFCPAIVTTAAILGSSHSP